MSSNESENISNPKAGRVQLIWCSRQTIEPGEQLLEHTHSYWQQYYVQEGHARFVSTGQEYTFGPGDSFLIPENITHELLPVKNEALKLYELKLAVTDRFISDRLKDCPHICSMQGSEDYFEYICRSWTDHNRQNLTDIECILTALLLKFFIGSLHYGKSDSSHFFTDGYSDLTRAVMVYIERKYPFPIRLSDIGQALCYNPNYLCTVFSEDTGITVVDFINLVRIRRAVIIFGFYIQDVTATAESVGFTNLSHFSRTFKKLVGVPPAVFRKAFISGRRADFSVLFSSEPVLSYRKCTVSAALLSLKRCGDRIRESEAGKCT